jgi:hypothetical protein
VEEALTPRHVADLGFLLYGQAWTCKLAHDLQVSERFLQRVSAAAKAGQPYDIPPGFLADLRAWAVHRAAQIAAAAAELQTGTSA